jgi:pantothenate kinase-related protein Tda10
MQGTGKTTLGKTLSFIYRSIGLKFDSVSLDDFYLSAKEQ